jgi:hypothetical protein
MPKPAGVSYVVEEYVGKKPNPGVLTTGSTDTLPLLAVLCVGPSRKISELPLRRAITSRFACLVGKMESVCDILMLLCLEVYAVVYWAPTACRERTVQKVFFWMI